MKSKARNSAAITPTKVAAGQKVFSGHFRRLKIGEDATRKISFDIIDEMHHLGVPCNPKTARLVSQRALLEMKLEAARSNSKGKGWRDVPKLSSHSWKSAAGMAVENLKREKKI